MPLKKNCDCLDSFEIIAQLSKATVNGRLERPCHIEAGLNRGLSASGRTVDRCTMCTVGRLILASIDPNNYVSDSGAICIFKYKANN